MIKRNEVAQSGKVGGRKRLFNSADFIVVLALLAVICGAVFRRPLEKMLDERLSSVKIEYTAEIYNASAQEENILSVGDFIYDENGTLLGLVESVENRSFENNGENESDATFANVVFTASADGFSDSDGLYLNREEPVFFVPGKTVYAHSSEHVSFSFVVKTTEIVG